MDQSTNVALRKTPWSKGKLVRQKAPLKLICLPITGHSAPPQTPAGNRTLTKRTGAHPVVPHSACWIRATAIQVSRGKLPPAEALEANCMLTCNLPRA